MARRLEQPVAEPELARLGLHVHLADDGDVAGDGQLEVADDEPVELGDTDPAAMVVDRRPPSRRPAVLGQQRSAARVGR